MQEKTCFKCGATQPLTEFYKNKGMKDGHLNKCRTCCAAYTRQYYKDHLDERLKYDRNRNMQPHRVEARKAYIETPAGKRARRVAAKNYKERFPDKDRARTALGNAVRDGRVKKQPCEICGSKRRVHGHHDDYGKPLKVRWLCERHHKDWHKHNEAKRGKLNG